MESELVNHNSHLTHVFTNQYLDSMIDPLSSDHNKKNNLEISHDRKKCQESMRRDKPETRIMLHFLDQVPVRSLRIHVQQERHPEGPHQREALSAAISQSQ